MRAEDYGPVVLVNGQPLSNSMYASLIGVRVERALCTVGRTTLRFRDTGFAISESGTFRVGSKVVVKQFPSTELFTGTIVAVGLELISDHPEFVVTADDIAYRLAFGTATKAHLQQDFGSIVQMLAREAGVTANVVSPPSEVNLYTLQAGTALAYIDAVSARFGYKWWIDGEVLQFTPIGHADGRCTLKLGEDLYEFSVRASALRPTSVVMTGWDATRQQEFDGKSSPSVIFKSQADLVAPFLKNEPDRAAVVTSSSLTPETPDEARLAAQGALDNSVTASVVARGACKVNGAIKPSVWAHFEDAGPASGDYLVSEVQHVYTTSGFVTRFVAGATRPDGIVDNLARPAPDPGFGISGLMIGTVSNVKDPDAGGRVKVKFATADTPTESNWARVLATSGGSKRGFTFIPEIGDEVLVGFEAGDTRRPIVLGSLFSKRNEMPKGTEAILDGNGAVVYRRVTSRTGHFIEFADGMEPAKQHLLLNLGTAHNSLRLGADAFAIDVVAGTPVTVQAGESKIAIDAEGSVSVEGLSITIKAKDRLDLEAPQVQIKGTAQVAVQAGATLEVKSDGVGNVEASGPLSLKGAMVEVN